MGVSERISFSRIRLGKRYQPADTSQGGTGPANNPNFKESDRITGYRSFLRIRLNAGYAAKRYSFSYFIHFMVIFYFLFGLIRVIGGQLFTSVSGNGGIHLSNEWDY